MSAPILSQFSSLLIRAWLLLGWEGGVFLLKLPVLFDSLYFPPTHFHPCCPPEPGELGGGTWHLEHRLSSAIESLLMDLYDLVPVFEAL